MKIYIPGDALFKAAISDEGKRSNFMVYEVTTPFGIVYVDYIRTENVVSMFIEAEEEKDQECSENLSKLFNKLKIPYEVTKKDNAGDYFLIFPYYLLDLK